MSKKLRDNFDVRIKQPIDKRFTQENSSVDRPYEGLLKYQPSDKKFYKYEDGQFTDIFAPINTNLSTINVNLTSINNKLNNTNTFNVKNYGAKGDGTTDDTDSIKSAITAIKTLGHGVLYFPSGSYKISSVLTIDFGNISIVGDGIGSTKIINYSTSGDCFYIGSPTQLRQVTLRDFTISASTQNTGSAIKWEIAVRCVCENLQLEKHKYLLNFMPYVFDIWCSKLNLLSMSDSGSAIKCDVGIQGGGIWVTDCTVDGGLINNNNGIELTSGSGSFFTNIDIRACGGSGILVNPPIDKSVGAHWFTNVLGDTCNGQGIFITGAGATSGLLFNGCWGSYCKANGLAITGSNVSTIEFNCCKFDLNEAHGIFITSGTNISINGGVVSGNSRVTPNSNNGIYISNVNKLRIIGVKSGQTALPNTQQIGCYVAGTTDYYLIKNCDFIGNMTNNLVDSATGTHKYVTENFTA